jgi:hypothetical protein
LERRGVETLDCRRAQFSAEEPIARLRMICQSWKVMFHAEYSSGQPLRMLVDLRAAVDNAVSKNSSEPAPRARAAAAGADSGPSPTAEFDVSAPSADWSEDASQDKSPSSDDGNA